VDEAIANGDKMLAVAEALMNIADQLVTDALRGVERRARSLELSKDEALDLLRKGAQVDSAAATRATN
jgi:hypothetical protein